MKNKQLIKEKIEALGFKLGTYDPDFEIVTKKEMKKVIESLTEEYTDVKVTIRKKDYIVEIKTVDDEKDINVLSIEQFQELYGWDDEEMEKFT